VRGGGQCRSSDECCGAGGCIKGYCCAGGGAPCRSMFECCSGACGTDGRCTTRG
jgi:hypothetical protein